MKKKIFIIFIALILSIFAIDKIIEKKAYLYFEDLLTSSQRNFIKKNLFPYKYIAKQDKIISNNYNMELNFKNSGQDILVGKMKNILTSDKTIIERYNLVNGFYLGMNKIFPGSGFIDFHNNKFTLLSSRGVLGYTNNLENDLHFKQIKNNINQFINLDQFLKNNSFSLKDLLVSNENIFVSYSEEVEEDCWNTSVGSKN